MLIAALAAASVASLLWRQQLWLRQFEQAADRTQARTLAGAGVRWAMLILHEDARQSAVDHGREPWAMRLPPTPLEKGEVSGYIVDQQGRFNLNDLVRDGVAVATAQRRFRRLLEELKLPVELADSLLDWLDADGQTRQPGGAEDGYYRSLPQAHLSANARLFQAEELLQVRGFSAEVWQKLRPLVTVLPQQGLPLNVNTAPGPVLGAFIEGLDLAQANALAGADRRHANVGSFRQTLPAGAIPPSDSEMSVASQYFEVLVEARQGDARARARAQVHRPALGAPQVIWQVFE